MFIVGTVIHAIVVYCTRIKFRTKLFKILAMKSVLSGFVLFALLSIINAEDNKTKGPKVTDKVSFFVVFLLF